MAYREYKGNIFASRAQTLVNTVNCVGVMGKGVALEFRHRFPEMFDEYKRVCASGSLEPGQILPYRKGSPWILNFAVKNDWKHPSRMEWVESCLRKFVESYRRLGITSVAMPWIGAMNGRLPWDQVHTLMRTYLSGIQDIDIEVIEYDPTAVDPLFQTLQSAVMNGVPEFAKMEDFPGSASRAIIRAVCNGEVRNLSEVLALDRLGKKTIERLYAFLCQHQNEQSHSLTQPKLL